jgi:predicted DNA-binding transcriptional regulator AlpA
MQRKLIKRKEVERRTGLSRWSISRLEKAKKFPRHVEITPGLHHWFEDEVDGHLARLTADREQLTT